MASSAARRPAPLLAAPDSESTPAVTLVGTSVRSFFGSSGVGSGSAIGAVPFGPQATLPSARSIATASTAPPDSMPGVVTVLDPRLALVDGWLSRYSRDRR